MAKQIKHADDRSIDWDYKPITKPGLYRGVPIEIYHSAGICAEPSVSSGGLRTIINKSLAHFYDTWPGNPDRADAEEKDHFIMGRALHHLVLGEPFFKKLFAIEPAEYVDEKTGEAKPWNNNAKVCRAWHEEQRKASRTALSQKVVVSLIGMSKSIGRHPFAGHALRGRIERSMFVKDKATGLWVKSRPDAIPGDSGDYVDLKKTTSVLWEDLRRTIFDFGYHQQLALARWCARELGLPFHSATLIFVEDKRPYCVRVVTIKDSDLDLGEQANRAALDAMAGALKTGRWTGPGGDHDAEHIELTAFARERVENRIKFGI